MGHRADNTALAQDTSTYQALSHSFETLLASYRAQRATHDAHLLQCALEKKVLPLHPGGNPAANLKSISHRCHPILVAFVWELTEETINLPPGYLQGGVCSSRLWLLPRTREYQSSRFHPDRGTWAHNLRAQVPLEPSYPQGVGRA